jgi:hypothetical protein
LGVGEGAAQPCQLALDEAHPLVPLACGYARRLRGCCFERRIISSLLIGGVARARLISSSRRLSLSRSEGVVMTDSPNQLPPEVERASRVYCELMTEIKTRLGFIHTTIAGLKAQPTQPFGFIGAECAILQLRNVCELMAHAAIAANRPFGKVDELLDSWHAQYAFQELKRLNDRCFPHPIGPKPQPASGPSFVEFDRKPPVTLRGLLRCYMRCGKLLHRGIVRHAFDSEAKIYDLDWIRSWATRIGDLLAHHATLVLGDGWIFLTHLEDEETGHVSVVCAEIESLWLEPDKGAARRYTRRERPPPE